MAWVIRKLGIDLGTVNTLVFLPKQGVILNEPSVVAVSEPDKKILAVGLAAKEMLGKTPGNITAYRPMRDGVIADYRVTEVMLRYYLSRALGPFNLFKPDVIISAPVGITSTERRAVVEAGLRAGALNVFVVKEPILAALGAGIPIHEPRGYMICDIGGGTTDVAIISLGGIVASASVRCAGNRLDQAIADYIKKTFNLLIGDQTAEEVKRKIGSAVPVDEEESYLIKGRDVLTGLPRSTEVRTNELVRAMEPELKEIIRAIKIVFQETPPELAADIIDHGIIMTGGTSLLNNLTELVYRRTGVKAYLADEAIFCVAKGTGVALEHLSIYKKNDSGQNLKMFSALLKKIEQNEPLHHAYLIVNPDIQAAAEELRQATGQSALVEHYENFMIEQSRELRRRQNLKLASRRQYFIIAARQLTFEAQQALLKTLEEPNTGNHFFLIVPKIDVVYQVLRSRFEIIVDERKKVTAGVVQDFIKAEPAKRLQIIQEIGDEKKNINAWLNELETALAGHGDAFLLAELKKTRGYTEKNVGGVLLALEHLALMIKDKL